MKLTHAEWQLMKALWRKHPATVREIGANLSGGTKWAYSTAKTMLTRLVAKGAVSERKIGNTAVYEPLVTSRRARLAALKSVAEEAFDGAFDTLVHFLVEERLSAGERKRLVKLLEAEMDKEDEK